jgi:hypothetical protein
MLFDLFSLHAIFRLRGESIIRYIFSGRQGHCTYLAESHDRHINVFGLIFKTGVKHVVSLLSAITMLIKLHAHCIYS